MEFGKMFNNASFRRSNFESIGRNSRVFLQLNSLIDF